MNDSPSHRMSSTTHTKMGTGKNTARAAGPASTTPALGSAAAGERGQAIVRDHRTTPRRGGVRSPASVWLCVPRGDEPDPLVPGWAARTIAEFSVAGEQVTIGCLVSYPGMVGEVAALTHAALVTGRRPVALLPTSVAATRTRALLCAFGSGEPDPVQHTAGHPAEEHNTESVRGDGGLRVAGGAGCQRLSSDVGPAGLVVALAGPVSAGARPPRQRFSPRLMRSWAHRLRPGGVLVVLRPSEVGTRGRRCAPGHGSIIAAAQDAELLYLQHIVLVHVPTTDTGVAHPDLTRRPHTPFWPVHTDALVFQSSFAESRLGQRRHPPRAVTALAARVTNTATSARLHDAATAPRTVTPPQPTPEPCTEPATDARATVPAPTTTCSHTPGSVTMPELDPATWAPTPAGDCEDPASGAQQSGRCA